MFAFLDKYFDLVLFVLFVPFWLSSVYLFCRHFAILWFSGEVSREGE